MEYQNIFDQMNEWEKLRLGKFTASRIFKLMQKGRSKSEYFGLTALKYIKSRMAEILTQEPCEDLEGLSAIEWGNNNEHDAILTFENIKKIKVNYYGKANPKFFPYPACPDFAGGSPDGETDDAVIEAKCPKNSSVHMAHLLIPNAEKLKDERADAYGQLQFNMICTGKKKGYFVSYDPRVLMHFQRLHVIEVPYDEDYCNELIERIERAVETLKEYLREVNKSILIAERDHETNSIIVTG